MKYKTTSLAALAALTLASSASAATITWGTATTISSSTEVSTLGTQVFGRSIAKQWDQPEAVVNGVNLGFNNPAWTVTFTETMGGSQATIPSEIPALIGPDASNYQAVLSYFRESNTTSASFGFGNLTVGQEYQIQFWAGDYRGYPNNRTETLTATGDTASPALAYLDSDGSIHGQYILGTFTADATSITFTMNANEDALYNAVQLRAIPEPTATLLGGLGLLALLRRRR